MNNIREILESALVQIQKGQYQAAYGIYEQGLAKYPQCAQIHSGMAVVLTNTGHPQQAQKCYQTALSLQKDQPKVWNNLVILQLQLNDIQEAIKTCYQGLQHLPQSSDLHHSLAFCLHQADQLEQAEVHYMQACQLDRNNAEAANHFGVMLSQQERHQEAMAYFQNALKSNPGHAEAANNYGLSCRALGQLDMAESQFIQALTIKPDFVEAHYNLAGVLHEKGEDEQAVAHCRQALNLNPNYGSAYNQLGIILQDQGKIDEAREAYEQALKLDCENAEFNSNMAILLKEEGEVERAEVYYLKALSLEPDFTHAHYNLGNLYLSIGRIADANRCYDKTIEFDPDYSSAHWNRAIASLLAGDMEKGWEDFNWRYKHFEREKLFPHNYHQPRWQGQSFVGQRLLVYCEQGHGDAIQFIRYLPIVKQLGGTVLLETWETLQTLFSSVKGVDELYVIDKNRPCPEQFDFAVSIMDLPYIFKTTLSTIPNQVPYLETDMEAVQQHRKSFESGRLKVGLVWAGNPQHGNDKNRSVTLEGFADILSIPGISFYSLQKGQAQKQLDQVVMNRPTDMGTGLNNFRDTANVIAALDMVISVDTAVAHLAGAMGKEVWTLLPFAPDWRWMIERCDSPWYPSMRLYRQPKIGDWNSVFEKLTHDLRNKITPVHPNTYTIV